MDLVNTIRRKLDYDKTVWKEAGTITGLLQFIRDLIVIFDGNMRSRLDYRIQTRTKEMLKADLADIIYKYRQNVSLQNKKISDTKTIWCFWAQGWNNAPEMVRICNNSLFAYRGGYNIVNLDLSNYSDYVEIPNHILDLFKDDKISVVNFSDILRVNLLSQNGGIWIDATILLTQILPDYIDDLTFFTVKHRAFRENEHICKGLWSTFFIGGSNKSAMCSFLQDAFTEYLKVHDSFGSYFLIDCFMALAYEEVPVIKQEVDKVPDNNIGVFQLCSLLENEYSKKEIISLCKNNFAHKMTYKSDYNEQLCKNARRLMTEI